MTAAQKNSSLLSYVMVAEQKRLNFACGPYLSDLQQCTVREDYGTTIRRTTGRFSILVSLLRFCLHCKYLHRAYSRRSKTR